MSGPPTNGFRAFRELARNGVYASWRPAFRRFQKTCGNWLATHTTNGPVYALPREVLAELSASTPASRGRRARKALLQPYEQQAEEAFLELCRGFNEDVVGVWEQVPVQYPLVSASMSSVEWVRNAVVEYEAAKAKRAGEAVDEARRCRAKLAGDEMAAQFGDYHHQMAAYAGWLTLNAQYRQELGNLRATWGALGKPLLFPLRAHERAWPGRLKPTIASFRECVRRFLNKWQLTSLVTWDLPEPQGPTIMPATAAKNLLGDQVIVALPSYFDIRSSRTFHDRVIEQQAGLARALGIGADHPLVDIAPTRLGSRSVISGQAQGFVPSAWETAFRLWFVERVARSRYGDRRGLSTRLEQGMIHWVAALDQKVGRDRILQIRRMYRGML